MEKSDIIWSRFFGVDLASNSPFIHKTRSKSQTHALYILGLSEVLDPSDLSETSKAVDVTIGYKPSATEESRFHLVVF